MRCIRKIAFVENKSVSPNVYSGIHIPRIGAVLLATLLRESGYEAEVFCEDITLLDTEKIFDADIVGLSALTNTVRPAYRLADQCRTRGIPTLMGGTHATFMADEALDHVDFVVKGEGEAPLLELLHALKAGRSVEGIPNLSYWSGGRCGRGKKVHNPNRAFVQDLDSLPIPDFGLVRGWGKGCVTSIMTSRGCPYDCTFCSVTAMLGRGYRYTSEDRVLEEIRRYRERGYIFFVDDNFVVNKKRTKRILERKIREGLGMEWSAQMRAEAAEDPELLRLMRDSNCFNVYVGFESFNPHTLALYNKRMEVDRIHRSIDLFHKYRIKVHGMFVLGSDADDIDSVRHTVRLTKKLGIDTAQFMILTPIPGTTLTEEFLAEGRIRTDDWDLFDGHYVTYEPRRLTPYELQRETLRAYRKFYSLPRIAGRALRGDKWTSLLRWGARRYLKQWHQQNRDFLENSKEEVSAVVRRLAAAGRPRRRQIAVVESLIPKHLLRFVKAFFGRLGVKVVSLRVEGAESVEAFFEKAGGALAKWREEYDFLVLPGEWPWKLSMAAAPLLEISSAQGASAVLRLPIEEDGTPSYAAFARLGRVFTASGHKVNRAFGAALREMGTVHLPVLKSGGGGGPASP